MTTTQILSELDAATVQAEAELAHEQAFLRSLDAPRNFGATIDPADAAEGRRMLGTMF